MAADVGLIGETSEAAIYKQKKQFYDQRREFNAILAREAREEHLFDCLRDAAERLNKQTPLFVAPLANGGYRTNDAVLVLTDWHYGMVADNIWNKFDTRICKERVQKLYQKVKYKLHLHEVSKLHVFILGDMANGAVHVTSRVAAEETVVDQLMEVSEILAEFISNISDAVERVEVHCTYGNHMRTIQSKQDSIHGDNMEKIIPWWLKERLKSCDNIEIVDISRDEIFFALVCGTPVCAVHGDLGGSPLVLSQMFEREFGQRMRYLFSGHLHSPLDTEEYGITSIRVGSLCGTDEFAKNKRLFSEPSQTLAIFNGGELDALYNIRLR